MIEKAEAYPRRHHGGEDAQIAIEFVIHQSDEKIILFGRKR